MNRLLVPLPLLGALCACTPSTPPKAPPPSVPERQDVALTVYNGGRALVKDTRSFDLTEGENAVRFDEVTSGIIPGSVQVTGESGSEVAVLEQNFEYDLVSTPKLLQRYLGETVQVTTESGEVHTGTLLAGSGDVILEGADGGVVVLRLDRIRDFAFPELPEGLASRPSLMWAMDAGRTGEHELTVTYLTGGFGWNADYIVQMSNSDDAVDLSGWVSVTNGTEASFRDARLKLVAGDVQMVATGDANQVMAELASIGYAAGGSGRGPVQRSFFDYHLYEMPHAVDLMSSETKQVEFVTVTGVPAVVTYELSFDGYWYGTTVTRHPSVAVELTNGEEQGMGMPLPAGTMRVYKADVDGAAELVGESAISHTPKDEKIRLTVGQAFDIVGEWKQTNHRVISDWTDEYSYEAVIRNHKTEEATVALVHHPYHWGDWKVLRSSIEATRADNNTLHFEVPVPAGGEVTLSYTIRNRW